MINNIEQGQVLTFENVLQYRCKADQLTLAGLQPKFENYLKQKDVKKISGMISINHSVEMKDGKQILDMEFLLPIDKEIKADDGFNFIKNFLVDNALMLKIYGNPLHMQSAIQQISEYIKSNNLTPKTPLIIHTEKEANNPMEVEQMITNLYIGV